MNRRKTDYRKIILTLIIGFLILTPLLTQAKEPVELWKVTYNSGATDNGRVIALDDTGNIYVAGFTGIGVYDILAIKYNPLGETIWLKTYDYNGFNDQGRGITLDETGDLYVSGFSSTGATTAAEDFLLIKYNSETGDTIWVRRYDGGNQDRGWAMALDSFGNPYISGYSIAANNDYLVIKYTPDGDTVWVRRYDLGPSDCCYGITIDASGNIYLTGGSSNGADEDLLTLKCDSTNGDTIWQARYDGGGLGVPDRGFDITVDETGNVYAAGYTDFPAYRECLTIKYDPANGNILWSKAYDYIGSEDHLHGIITDPAGNVYVAGLVNYPGSLIIAKYTPAGDTVWLKTYGRAYNELGAEMAVDSAGFVYVTGWDNANGMNNDLFLFKYMQFDAELIKTQRNERKNPAETDSTALPIYALVSDTISYAISFKNKSNTGVYNLVIYDTGSFDASVCNPVLFVGIDTAGADSWSYTTDGITWQDWGSIPAEGAADVTGLRWMVRYLAKDESVKVGFRVRSDTVAALPAVSNHAVALVENGIDTASATSNAVICTYSFSALVVSAKTVSETQIEISFSEYLDASSVQATDFTVAGNAVTDTSVLDNTVTLTLGVFIGTGDVPQVDLAGLVLDTNSIPVNTGSLVPSDGIPPRLIFCDVVSRAVCFVNFSETMNPANVTDKTAYTQTGASGAGALPNPDGVMYNPAAQGYVLFYENNPFAETDNILVSITDTVTDLAGNPIDPLYNSMIDNPAGGDTMPYMNDFVRPQMTGAKTITDTSIEIYFDKEMIDPAIFSMESVLRHFSVEGNTFTNAALKSGDSTTLVLAMQEPIGTGDVPQVTATWADTAMNQSDTATVTPADGIPPLITLADVISKRTLLFQYSETMSPAALAPVSYSQAGATGDTASTNPVLAAALLSPMPPNAFGLSFDFVTFNETDIIIFSVAGLVTDLAGNPIFYSDTITVADNTIGIDDFVDPVLTGAKTTGETTVEVYFSEDVSNTVYYPMDTAALSVEGDTVDGISVTGNTVILSVRGSLIANQAPVITVTGEVSDKNGNLAADGETVAAADGIPPRLVFCDIVSRSVCFATFSETMDPATVVDKTGYTQTGASGAGAVPNPEMVMYNTVFMPGYSIYYGNAPFAETDNILITVGETVTDLAGNPIDPAYSSVSDNPAGGETTPIMNDFAVPQLIGAKTITETSIEIYFDKNMVDPELFSMEGVLQNFKVAGNTPTYAALKPGDSATIALTMESPIGTGDMPGVTAAWADTFMNYSDTATVTPADGIPPKFLSADVYSQRLVFVIFSETTVSLDSANFIQTGASGEPTVNPDHVTQINSVTYCLFYYYFTFAETDAVTITALNVHDVSGNTLVSSDITDSPAGGEPGNDFIPPLLVSARAISETQVVAVFDKKINAKPGTTYYSVDTYTMSGIDSPGDKTAVITLVEPMPTNATPLVSFPNYGITDTAGNFAVEGQSVTASDSIAPKVLSCDIYSKSMIAITFSESVPVFNTSSCTQTGGTGINATPNPAWVYYSGSNLYIAGFSYPAFNETDAVTVDLANVSDVFGNVLVPASFIDDPAGGEAGNDFTPPALLDARTISETQVIAHFSEIIGMMPGNTTAISVDTYTNVSILCPGTGDTALITIIGPMPTYITPLVTVTNPSNIFDTAMNPCDAGANVIAADGIPPKLLMIDVASRAYVMAVFSETMSASALNLSSYSQSGGTGESATANPAIVMYDPFITQMFGSPGYDLMFNYPTFYETNSITISVSNIADLAGNTLSLAVFTDNPAGGEAMNDFIPPTLFRAKVLNNTQVLVIFSEYIANDISYGIVLDTNSILVDTYTNASIATPASYCETVIVTINGTISAATVHIIRIAGAVFDGWLNQARIGETVATTISPKLVYFNVLSKSACFVMFDNLMDLGTALNPVSYSQSGAPGSANPSFVMYDTSIIPMFVLVYNNAPFTAVQNITMTATSTLIDINGNIINPSFRTLSDNPAGGETWPIPDDFTSPQMLGAAAKTDTTIEMFFSEGIMNPGGSFNTQTISVTGNTVTSIANKPGDTSILVICVAAPMGTADRPQVTLQYSLMDDVGNPSNTGTVTAGDSIPPKVTIYLTASKRVFGIAFSETMSATALNTSAYTQFGATGSAKIPNPQQIIITNVGGGSLAHMLLFPYPTFTLGDSITMAIAASVKDLAGNSMDPAFSLLPDPSAGTNTSMTDFIDPILMGAKSVGQSTIEVYFSENVNNETFFPVKLNTINVQNNTVIATSVIANTVRLTVLNPLNTSPVRVITVNTAVADMWGNQVAIGSNTVTVDAIGPRLAYFNVISQSACFVGFDKAVNLATAFDTNAYTMTGAPGDPHPQQVQYDTSITPVLVLIYNNAPFRATQNITMTVATTVTDTNGNHLDPGFAALSDAPAGGEIWPVVDDFTGPHFLGARTKTETTVEMLFDETLMDPVFYGGSFELDQFTVSGNTVSAVVFKQGDSKTLVLTVTSQMKTGSRPSVSLLYPLGDTFGNPSDTGSVTASDSCPPKVIIWLAVSKRAFGILYSETMSAAALNTAAYTQTGATGNTATAHPVSVSAINMDTSSMPYFLMYPYQTFKPGDSITMSITSSVKDSSGNTIDPAFQVLVDPSAGSDTSKTDFTSPVLLGAKSVGQTTIEAYFSEDVSNETYFQVKLNSITVQSNTVIATSVIANTVRLTVQNALNTSPVRLITVTGPVPDMWGNNADPGETAMTVDAIGPRLSYFNVISQSACFVGFDKAVNFAAALDTNAYTITGAPGDPHPQQVQYDTSIIPVFVLIYSYAPFRADQNITMTVATTVTDTNGNHLDPGFAVLSDNPAGGEISPIMDDFTGPHFMGARTKTETTVEMLFDETLMDPAAYGGSFELDQFAVAGNTVTAAAIKEGDSKTIIMILACAIGTGDRPSVSLLWPVSDTFGNPSDTGTVTASDSIPPRVMLIDVASKRVVFVMFSETMPATTLNPAYYTQAGATGNTAGANPGEVFFLPMGGPGAVALKYPYATFNLTDNVTFTISGAKDSSGNNAVPYTGLCDVSDTLTMDNDFTDPLLLGAKAVGEFTIEAYFSEDVSNETYFPIKLNALTVENNTVVSTGVIGNTVILTVSNSLVADPTRLVTVTGAVCDMPGNQAAFGETALTLDALGPRLRFFNVISRSACVMNYDKPMDIASASDTNIYTVTGMPGDTHPFMVMYDASMLNTEVFILVFEGRPFRQGQNIQLTVATTVVDSNGNHLDPGYAVLSDNPAGGDVWPVVDDFTGPSLLGAKTVGETTIEIYFSETIMSGSGALNTQSFAVTDNAVLNASTKAGDTKTVVLTLQNVLGTGDRPSVSLPYPLNDTFGNPSDTGTIIPADGIAPRATNLGFITQYIAGVVFSEGMLPDAALQDRNNYPTSINGVTNTFPVSVDLTANPLVKLTYGSAFNFGETVSVTVSTSIKDSSSNAIDPSCRSVTSVLTVLAGDISIDLVLMPVTVSAAGSAVPKTVAVRVSNAASCDTVVTETVTAKTKLTFVKDGVNLSKEYEVTQPAAITLGAGQSGWCTFTITRTGTTNGDIEVRVTMTGRDRNAVESSENTGGFMTKVYTTAANTATQAQMDAFGNTLSVITIPGNSMNTDALVLIENTASGTEAGAVIQANGALPSGFALVTELGGTLKSISALALSNTSTHATFTSTATITLTIYYTGIALPAGLEANLKIYRLTGNQWVLVTGTQTVDTVKKCVTVTINGFSVYRLLTTSLGATDLSGAIVYPNPYKPAYALGGTLKFDKLTVDAAIKIYNVAGELVITLGSDKVGSSGKYEWDGKNQLGEPVASGVYLYVVTSGTIKPAVGKFVLIR